MSESPDPLSPRAAVATSEATAAAEHGLAIANEPQREWLSLVTARVRDTYIRKPFFVDGALDLVSLCGQLQALGLTSALVNDVQDGRPRLGLFTTTDLRDALLRAQPPQQLAVREVARFNLIEVHPDADLFEALWLMVRHRVHRLVVREGTRVLGLLGQLDVVSFVANHSHIVALQIDEAADVAALQAAAMRIDAMVAWLHEGGIKIERIARMVSELNGRLFARLWSLLAPADLVANSCLLVMGSEGRGEQIVKTDQDNALILRDGFECADLPGIAERFNGALAELGYPPCPGRIMLSNPLWRPTLAQLKDRLHEWVYGADPEAPMHLAIFLDSQALAGDAQLLEEARSHLDRIMDGSDRFLAHFARAIDQFDDSPSWWQRLTSKRSDSPIDLKKLGTFPIVHGVRALALQQRLRATGTAARLRALVEGGQLDAALARDVLDALHFIMALKLTHQLRQRQAGQVANNLVHPGELGALERDPLHDALAIVRRFRAVLAQRFQLGAL